MSIEREPALVGSAAHAFTTNWAASDWRQFPDLDEALAFVTEYEAARGAPFSSQERRAARAALTYSMAYTARCEHSDVVTSFGEHAPEAPPKPVVPSGTARAFLVGHADELLEMEVGLVPAVD